MLPILVAPMNERDCGKDSAPEDWASLQAWDAAWGTSGGGWDFVLWSNKKSSAPVSVCPQIMSHTSGLWPGLWQ